jgi:hypothetical protein
MTAIEPRKVMNSFSTLMHLIDQDLTAPFTLICPFKFLGLISEERPIANVNIDSIGSFSAEKLHSTFWGVIDDSNSFEKAQFPFSDKLHACFDDL